VVDVEPEPRSRDLRRSAWLDADASTDVYHSRRALRRTLLTGGDEHGATRGYGQLAAPMSGFASLASGVSKALRTLGITLVALGAVTLVAPWMAGAALVMVVGLVLLAAGGILTLVGLQMREAGKGSAGVIAGALGVLAGGVLVFDPGLGLAAVRWILIAYFMVGGSLQVSTALQLAEDEGRMWAIVDGAWSVALGVVMLTGWPVSGATAIGLLVGIKLMASGLTLIRLHGRLRTMGYRLAAARERFG
jgi:uncharacterized membrane protein HdeD (DUF308 family)